MSAKGVLHSLGPLMVPVKVQFYIRKWHFKSQKSQNPVFPCAWNLGNTEITFLWAVSSFEMWHLSIRLVFLSGTFLPSVNIDAMLFVLVTEWGIELDRSISHHSWLWECIVHQRLGEDGGVPPSLHGVTSPTVAAGGKNMSEIRIIVQVSFKGSVQFSCSVMSDSLRPHGLQHSRTPCPSPTPRACSNSCPLNRWCYPTISSSVIPFASCLQSFPASGSFPVSQFLTSGGKRIGASASASVLPMNIQDWFPLGWTGWISLQSKGLSRIFSNTTVQKHQFFGVQLSSQSNSHIHTWPLEKP